MVSFETYIIVDNNEIFVGLRECSVIHTVKAVSGAETSERSERRNEESIREEGEEGENKSDQEKGRNNKNIISRSVFLSSPSAVFRYLHGVIKRRNVS